LAVQLIQGPAVEPLSLDEAKLHLRVDIVDDDELITVLIQAAREYCEEFCHRAFITQTWKLVLDHFPGVADHNQGYADLGVMGDAALGIGLPPVGYTFAYQSEVYFRAGSIIVPKPPLQSIDFINYLDLNGDSQTLGPASPEEPSDNYQIDVASEPARLAPPPNGNWPLTLLSIRAPVLNAVVIQFVCGYGDAATDVPASVRAAMKLMIAHWYENRSHVLTGFRAAAVEIPDAADTLLWRNKVVYAV
jgi:uncharacterized phiE125 gp8 family phage protein